jgi:hypothetical protein
MNTFKVGDRVRCSTPGDRSVVGTVTAVGESRLLYRPDRHPNEEWVTDTSTCQVLPPDKIVWVNRYGDGWFGKEHPSRQAAAEAATRSTLREVWELNLTTGFGARHPVEDAS